MNHFKTLKEINSKRTYKFFFSKSDNPAVHSLIDILNHSLSNDYEWAHAVCDQLDDLLDLRIAETMFLDSTNRDDKDDRREKVMIVRTR